MFFVEFEPNGNGTNFFQNMYSEIGRLFKKVKCNWAGVEMLVFLFFPEFEGNANGSNFFQKMYSEIVRLFKKVKI